MFFRELALNAGARECLLKGNLGGGESKQRPFSSILLNHFITTVSRIENVPYVDNYAYVLNADLIFTIFPSSLLIIQLRMECDLHFPSISFVMVVTYVQGETFLS